MRYKRPALLLLLVALSVGCATVRPGEDPVLVRAQQTYETARETANLLFVLEDQHQDLLESKLPGTHKTVEGLRLTVRKELPNLLRAIDAYEAARSAGKSDLLTALAVVDEFLDEIQALVSKVAGVTR